LPELVLIEEIQQVAMKRDESLSPSLFIFGSHFAAIRRDWYYVFMTARKKYAPFNIRPTGNYRFAHREFGQIT
jgi:hypothetical protein